MRLVIDLQACQDGSHTLPSSPAAQALAQRGQRWSAEPEEIGAANALVFNPDGTVTAVSEGWRHGVGSAMVQKSAH